MELSELFGKYVCSQLKERYGVTTVEDAQKISEKELIDHIRNFGKMSYLKLTAVKLQPAVEYGKRLPHRQICSICHEECAIDFRVPNDVWWKAIHSSRLESLHCIRCFIKSADARLVDWSSIEILRVNPLIKHIEFLKEKKYIS